eukprot:5332981-Ditylum_brightwellii.AAC.2
MAGITKEFYQSTPECPFFNDGQALHSICTGVQMFSVCRSKKAERIADAYVDDTGNTYVNEETQKDETP